MTFNIYLNHTYNFYGSVLGKLSDKLIKMVLTTRQAKLNPRQKTWLLHQLLVWMRLFSFPLATTVIFTSFLKSATLSSSVSMSKWLLFFGTGLEFAAMNSMIARGNHTKDKSSTMISMHQFTKKKWLFYQLFLIMTP